MLLGESNARVSIWSHHRAADRHLTFNHLCVMHISSAREADLLPLSLLAINLRSHGLNRLGWWVLRGVNLSAPVGGAGALLSRSVSHTGLVTGHAHANSVVLSCHIVDVGG